MGEIRSRLAERRIGLEITEQASNYIAETAYDPVYGARPLKRFLQHELETRIGRALLSGEIGEGGLLRLDLADGQLQVLAS